MEKSSILTVLGIIFPGLKTFSAQQNNQLSNLQLGEVWKCFKNRNGKERIELT